MRVNGVRLGADPTPVLHGDKIEIGRARDPGGGSRPRRAAPSSSTPAPSPIWFRPSAAKPPAGPHRRPAGVPHRRPGVHDRAAGPWSSAGTRARVVVAGNEVSRHHAEIETTAEGYVLVDLSVNGTYVNGERIGRSHLLARADVIRIGNDEFRFYADAAPPPSPDAAPERAAAGPRRSRPRAPANRLSDTMHGFPPTALSSSGRHPGLSRRRPRSRRCCSAAASSGAGACRSRCRW